MLALQVSLRFSHVQLKLSLEAHRGTGQLKLAVTFYMAIYIQKLFCL